MKQALHSQGIVPAQDQSPAALTGFIAEEVPKWRALIKSANVSMGEPRALRASPGAQLRTGGPDPRCPDLGTAVGCGAPGVWRQAHGAPASRKPTLTTNLRVLMSPQAFRRRRACRLHGDRPVPRAGRSVLHADSCRPRRRRAQDRAAGRRRKGWGPPFLGETASLLHRREPQQARHGAGSVAAGGPGAAARAAGRRRRAGRELQARHAGEMGLGLRDAEPGIPEADPLPRQRLRRRRAAGRPARLRRLRPGHVRPDEREWRGRWRSHPRRPARGGHGHRPERGRGGAAGAERARAQRPGPVPGHHAVRLRAVAAAPARAQLFLQRQDAGPQRQRASQHRAL